MPDYTALTQDQLVNLLNTMERRLRALETAPRAPYTTIEQGTMQVIDELGNTVVKVGKLSTGTYGIVLLNQDGRIVFETTQFAGQIAPLSIYTPAISPGATVSLTGAARWGTTSGSYITMMTQDFYSVGNTIQYQINGYPNAGTMDWKITCEHMAPGGTAVTMLEETGITTQFNDLHIQTLPDTCLDIPGSSVVGRYMRVSFLTRRTAGTSTVDLSVWPVFMNYGA